ncbi:hypothetical protein [Salinibacterium sp. ZJ77]|uniref:hypothetical protein n=1 Tax=Salinibacterium sp. ZJ77 TaxID=2708337 RepID=UPI00141F8799|nr:hypothetical protein [Salinibacterium sp. ZJ77]
MHTVALPPPARTDTSENEQPLRPRGATPAALRILCTAAAVLLAVAAALITMPWPADASGFAAGSFGAAALVLSLAVIVIAAHVTGAFGTHRVARLAGTAAAGGLIAGTALYVIGVFVPAATAEIVIQTALISAEISYWLAGVTIAAAGVWRGAARILPLLAASWPVTAVAVAIVDGTLQDAAWVAFILHLLVLHLFTVLTVAIDAHRLVRE